MDEHRVLSSIARLLAAEASAARDGLLCALDGPWEEVAERHRQGVCAAEGRIRDVSMCSSSAAKASAFDYSSRAGQLCAAIEELRTERSSSPCMPLLTHLHAVGCKRTAAQKDRKG